jgi:hypothetical protein
MRKLASIQTITDIKPIPNKDKIEIATILGWNVIVAKGFNIGDKVIYCEVDTILPEIPEFEFLRSRCYSPKWHGFRIKTMKMGEVFSQGIVFPIDIITKKMPKLKLEIGLDITDYLNIRKYDPELLETHDNKKKNLSIIYFIKQFLCNFSIFRKLLLSKNKQKGWPSWLRKTDETRIQSMPNILEEYKDLKVYVTLKMDGSSATYAFNNKKFYVFSRNIYLRNKDNSRWWQAATIYNIKQKLKHFCNSQKEYQNLAIQGEVCGPGIQDNKYHFNSIRFFVFSIFDINKQEYLAKEEFDKLVKILDLPSVPTIAKNISLESISKYIDNNPESRMQNIIKYTREQCEEKSELSKIIGNENFQEGIVIRSMDGNPKHLENMGSHFSFKVINPDFAIKYGL